MKTIRNKALIVLSVFFGFLYSSCQKEINSEQPISGNQATLDRRPVQTFYGPTIPIGEGVARAWVSQNPNGVPIAVGINLSEKALENLPGDPRQFVFNFPNHGATHFFTHMLVDWNPQGHEPAGVYDVPHFDFHFYTVSNSFRLGIGPNDSTQFANEPDSQYVPPMYLRIPGGVPQMGAHWIDLLSDEFNGGPFTKTFILGSYDGEFIFWEPMITRAYLLSHPDDNIPLRQPTTYKNDGWYPQSYQIKYSDRPGEYSIALTDLRFHQGQ